MASILTAAVRRSVPSKCTKIVTAATVFVFHLAILLQLAYVPVRHAHGTGLKPESTSAVTWLVEQDQSGLETVPLPEVQLQPFRLESTALEEIRFDDPEQGDVSGVIALASAPHLTQFRPDVDSFACLAGLAPGQVTTVVVVIEVLTNGSVGTVTVSRTSGSLTIDAAALGYARSLHWVPGTTDRHARVMRITFPVTLRRSR